MRLLLCLCLVLTAAPLGSAAQGAGRPFAARDLSPLTADAAERLVGVPVNVDAAALAAGVGAQLVELFGPGVLPLSLNGPGQVALLRWPSAAAAEQGASALVGGGLALFAEFNFKARQPETFACAAAQQAATAEQCTAAFVDGTPTAAEYLEQPGVAAIALDQMPAPVGAGTLVAVIDTGLDPAHPLLVGRVAGPGLDLLSGQPGGWERRDGVDDDGDGLIDEAHGHGTHVAGLIALVDPTALLLPYRVLDADGNGSAFDVARAIYLAAEEGAQCINLSIGLAQPSAAVAEAIRYATGDDDDGAVVVASAGNRAGEGVGYIAALPETLAVAAVGDDGRLASFASYGPEVDLVAPGVQVYSATAGGEYARWSGSSMSAAIASGAVARLLSSDPSEDPQDARDALIEGAVSVDAINPKIAGLLGAGLIHLPQALAAL